MTPPADDICHGPAQGNLAEAYALAGKPALASGSTHVRGHDAEQGRAASTSLLLTQWHRARSGRIEHTEQFVRPRAAGSLVRVAWAWPSSGSRWRQANKVLVCLGIRISSPMRPVCWIRVTGTSCTGRPAGTPTACQH